jgi:FkbM family methyltransferase
MSWRTHPFVIRLRNLGRAAGLSHWLARLLATPGYETKFRAIVFATVSRGDLVWDVGANVGLYTVGFAERVGSEGRVFAFEPSPINQARLRVAVEELTNVVIVPLALGAEGAMVRFEQGGDRFGATSRVLDGPGAGEGDALEVQVERGDALVAAGTIPLPSIIKIDTEGAELDVLRGLEAILDSPGLRALCIEVHFGLLNDRGVSDGPRQIERILSAAGFRYRWSDSSHIIATRHSP